MNKISTPAYIKVGYATASLILLLGIYMMYVLLTATPLKLFNANYQPYQAQVVRGNGEPSAIKSAYQDGNMDSVIWGFNSKNVPQPEDYILTGIAHLEKNEPAKAIQIFRALIDKNTATNEDFFEEDAEYYLAMSYLGNQESEKALPIFEKILSDKDNSYHSNVSEWFLMNVKYSIVKK